MNAQKIHDILSTSFDPVSWNQVLREVFGARVLHQTPQPIKLPANDLAEKAVELGHLNTSDDRIVGLYQVDLTDKPQIWRNRVGLRSLLKNVYTHDVDAALVVFVQGDKWRLSLISEISVRDEKTDEIIDQKTEPKRYTYLLGKDETVRTPAERFEAYARSDAKLKSLIDTFAVESLNKDFFKGYKSVFDAVLVEVSKQVKDDETARLFSQRLLNRLMFLYFIQKKEWMHFRGDANYLRRVFDAAEENNENFYRDRLYYVFFYGLSNLGESREIADNTKLEELRGVVPYLNGGLFELEKDGLDERGKVELTNERFKDILGLFEQYNFTIDESTPFEVQVAVDPEMLGKVFEELVTGRHSSGSYYTPRTVVSFMCRESLKHSLKGIETEEIVTELVDQNIGDNVKNPDSVIDRLRELRICDPACGSGAYLLGMLQELLHVREALYASKKIASDAQYKWKREIIENNIYGVDIDRFATQIAALRLWLSLAIESDEPHPLPNLKYKIGCGDSLLSPIETVGQRELHRTALIEQFKARKKEYTDADDHQTKSEAEKEIERLRVELAQVFDRIPPVPKTNEIVLAKAGVQPLKDSIARLIKVGDKGQAEKFQKQLNQLERRITELDAAANAPAHYDSGRVFDWSVEFAEIFEEGGFDIVLANPPYIQLELNDGQLARLYESEDFETFTRRGDIYLLFYERGFDILKKGGVLSYITSNKWMRAKYGEKTRRFFVENTTPLLIIDFGNVRVFSTATVDSNILILQKAEKKDGDGVLGVRTDTDYDLSQSLLQYVQRNGYELTSLTSNSWVIGPKDEFDIKARVENQGVPLNKWDIDFTYGFRTGFNPAYIIDRHRKDALIAEDPVNAALLRPILRGKDIKAWFPEFADLWLVVVKKGFAQQLMNNYPTIYKYLETYEENLKARAQVRMGNHHWVELDNSPTDDYVAMFDSPKIIYPNMTKYLPFVYDESGFCINDKAFIVTGSSLKYLTCFFNSKLFKYCFSDNFAELQGGTRELRKVFFDKIPVKQISDEDAEPFNSIVDFIILLKKYRLVSGMNINTELNETVVCSFFEQLSDALILETYLPDEFQQFGVEIKRHLPRFPLLSKNDLTDNVSKIVRFFEEIEHFEHPVRANLSTMKSIPVIQLIYNTVRI